MSIYAEDCELCDEVRLAGTAATGRTASFGAGPPFSRLIKRTTSMDVIAGLGSLLPGYLLLVPRRHIFSIGELGAQQIREAYDLAWSMIREVRSCFGCRAVMVEHGSSGGVGSAGRACIAHGHIHVFPVPPASDVDEFHLEGASHVFGLTRLREAAVARRNYYYSCTVPGEGRLLLDPEIGSQYPRRVWASLLGLAEDWDWAVAPFMDNVRTTVALLRADLLADSAWPVGIPLTAADRAWETVSAYDRHAKQYAIKTQDFGNNSSLPGEIRSLMKATNGLILDAGAGGCRDAVFMADAGRTVIALDASRGLLAEALSTANCHKVAGDIRGLPLHDESVGAVWCSAVLLHLDAGDVALALREFFRVLAFGGLVQISVKEGQGHTSQAFGPQDDAGTPVRRHFYYYERRPLETMVRQVGFTVERIWMEDEADSAGIVQRWLKLLMRKPDRDSTSSSSP